jgi:hypothetical protein
MPVCSDWSLLSKLSTNILYSLIVMRTLCYFHLALGLSILTVLGEKHKFWRLLALSLTSAAMKLLFVSLHRPSILPLVGPDVLSTLF